MKVRLIDITENAEKQIVYIARVSNPNNQDSPEYEKLIKYCIEHQHWSIFEHSHMTVEIETSTAIATQILRHRSFTFQQFCVAGDVEIYYDLPGKVKKGKRQLNKMRIDELWRKWHGGAKAIPNRWDGSPQVIPMRERLKQIYVRVLDQETDTFSHAHISNVFQTGIKPIFEVTLENGKKIRCTKEHKFLVKDRNWLPLEDAVKLSWQEGRTAVMSQEAFVACNGIPVYQDKTWMEDAKQRTIKNKTGVEGIAAEAGVSYHTIRKWLRIHGLQFSKKETASFTEVWNKGKFGYSTGLRSDETKAKLRASAKRGADNPLWRGGVDREWRIWVSDQISARRRDFLKAANYQCAVCGSNKKLHLHHIKPVYEHPELALEPSNIQVVCRDCHGDIHKNRGDVKEWRERSSGNALTVRWVKIKTVKYIGMEMTYDLEMDHHSHNYVANGIVVHNSQRYSDPTKMGFEPIEWRKQAEKNRQSSSGLIDPSLVQDFNDAWSAILDEIQSLYDQAISFGVAKECARFILPQCTTTRMYMTGNVRSYIHYLQLRTKPDTQKEHRLVAEAIKKIFISELPVTSLALGWIQEKGKMSDVTSI